MSSLRNLSFCRVFVRVSVLCLTAVTIDRLAVVLFLRLDLLKFNRVVTPSHCVLRLFWGCRILLSFGHLSLLVLWHLLCGLCPNFGDAASLRLASHRCLVGLALPHLLLVAVEHAGRETLQNPFVAQPLVWCQTLLWVPLQALADQVNELWIRDFTELLHDVLQPLLLLTVADNFECCGHGSRLIVELLEEVLSSRPGENTGIWHADNVDDQLDLLALIGPWEEREACEQFNQDAAETPHIDLLGVREHSQHDVWCSVEPTLDVGVHDLVLEATAAEISDRYSALVLLLHQNVLRLQVTVDHTEVLQVSEAREELDGESANKAVIKALVVIHLYEFIQVD